MGQAEPTQGISDAASNLPLISHLMTLLLGERDNRSNVLLLPAATAFVHAERIGELCGPSPPQLLARIRCPARKPDDVKGRAQPASGSEKFR